MRRFNPTVCVGLALCGLIGGCAAPTGEPEVVVGPDTRLVPASLLSEDRTEGGVVEVPVPVASPQLRPLGGAEKPGAPSTAPSATQPSSPRAGRDEEVGPATRPAPEGFLHAVERYDFATGVVYPAVTSPGFVTTIALRPGEQLVTASAGDTTRWALEPVETGAGATRQTLVLLKPRKPMLRTNLVITTDQRVYQLDLTSVESGAYHMMIAWDYPFGDVVAIRNQAAEAEAKRQATVGRGLDLGRLNFNYLILKQKGPTPRWTPLRAFDDGAKTYVQFPPAVGVTEAPPLFVLGRHGDAQLVNYRVRGTYYVVDRLFDRAELRVGEKPQTIVRIVRADPRDDVAPAPAARADR